MPRMAPLDRAQVTDEAAGKVFDAFVAQRGAMPNMFATLARLPQHLVSTFEHFKTVMNEGTLPLRLKELVGVRVSVVNSCDY